MPPGGPCQPGGGASRTSSRERPQPDHGMGARGVSAVDRDGVKEGDKVVVGGTSLRKPDRFHQQNTGTKRCFDARLSKVRRDYRDRTRCAASDYVREGDS